MAVIASITELLDQADMSFDLLREALKELRSRKDLGPEERSELFNQAQASVALTEDALKRLRKDFATPSPEVVPGQEGRIASFMAVESMRRKHALATRKSGQRVEDDNGVFISGRMTAPNDK